MKAIEHKLSIQQVLAWVRQCTPQEKETLLCELVNGAHATMLASEESLAKDWNGKEEDEAWKNL